jgi:transformation/transcription domain-associated protein
LVPLKVSALAALAACHYLPELREKIFAVLYKTINSPHSVKEIQEAGKMAMKKVGTVGGRARSLNGCREGQGCG